MQQISKSITIAIAALSAILGYMLGKYIERARTKREILRLKNQILEVCNKTITIRDRHKTLLYLCAAYEIALRNASKSDDAAIKNLVSEFSPISALLKEANASLIERLDIHIRKGYAKWRLMNILRKGLK